MKATYLIAMLMLAACGPLTVPSSAVPVYEAQTPQQTVYLTSQIAVGTVTAHDLSYGALEQRALKLEAPEVPLAEALKSAGLLAEDVAKAPYTLDVDIREVGNAVCMFGECTIYISAAYRLVKKGDEEPIWQRRIKTKHLYKHGTFSRMDDATHGAIIGSALAASYEELVALLIAVQAPEKTTRASPKKTP